MKATSGLEKTLDRRYIHGRVAYLKSWVSAHVRVPVTVIGVEATSRVGLPQPAHSPHLENSSPGHRGPRDTGQDHVPQSW